MWVMCSLFGWLEQATVDQSTENQRTEFFSLEKEKYKAKALAELVPYEGLLQGSQMVPSFCSSNITQGEITLTGITFMWELIPLINSLLLKATPNATTFRLGFSIIFT